MQILTPMHPWNAQPRRGSEFCNPVTNGDRTVVGAGVTRDVFAACNPCHIIREIPE